MLVQRWGIIWKPLQFSMKQSFAITHACIRLHNFRVQRRLPMPDNNITLPAIAAVDAIGDLIDNLWRAGAEPTEEWRRNGVGSCLREHIVKVIEEKFKLILI